MRPRPTQQSCAAGLKRYMLMIKPLFLFFVILLSTTSFACEVNENELIMAYDLSDGDSELKFLDLFWEDGGYIFNATTISDTELVGEWNYKDCILELQHLNGTLINKIVINVISKQNGILTVKFKGGINNATLIKHRI